MSNKMVIYAAGGAAMNIASSMLQYDTTNDEGFCDIDTYFIDTSKSNLVSKIPDSKTYLLEGLDGSGKNRRSNYEVLSESAVKVLHQFKPGDINVVLHSSSGGTGSTLGPILASELLNRGENVVVFTIGSTSSKIEIDNTIKTLKSYEMISKKRGKAVNVLYDENSIERSRGTVDRNMQIQLVFLATIFSGDNKELDASDLSNMLNYERVTSFEPRLGALELHTSDISVEKNSHIVTVATLVNDDVSSELSIPVEYQAVGYINDEIKDKLEIDLPLHLVIVLGFFNRKINELEAKLKEHEEARLIVDAKTIVDDDEDSTDEGLIL